MIIIPYNVISGCIRQGGYRQRKVCTTNDYLTLEDRGRRMQRGNVEHRDAR